MPAARRRASREPLLAHERVVHRDHLPIGHRRRELLRPRDRGVADLPAQADVAAELDQRRGEGGNVLGLDQQPGLTVGDDRRDPADRRRQRRLELEKYLKAVREKHPDTGLRSVMNLMANLGMSEAQVLEAAFASKIVKRWTTTDENGRADCLFFQFDKRSGANRDGSH